MANMLELVARLFGVGVILLTARVLYNVFFHPLAAVPGPFIARASGIPAWYHAFKGDRHIWLWQTFEIYGSPIRISPDTVLFQDPDAHKTIYGMKSNVQKSGFYTAWQKDALDAHTLNTVDVADHAAKRRLLNLCFSADTTRAASDFIVRHIDRWNELLVEDIPDTQWSKSKNFSEEVDKLVFDIMGDLCFGKSLDIKEPGDNPLKEIPHAIAGYMRFFNPIARSPFLNLVLWLKPRGWDAFIAKLSPPPVVAFSKFVQDSVTDRIQLQEKLRKSTESAQRHDLFHFLAEARDPETKEPAFDEIRLRAELSLLVIAGSDTTSTSLSAIMFCLSTPSQQHRLKKLTKQLRDTFNSADEIVPGPKLTSCVYLKACIDEAMRLTPPGPSELSREVKSGGINILGKHYPAGTIVGTAGHTTGRNARVYGNDCLSYRPERWIVDPDAGVTEESVARCKANFHPFSTGPGNCIGKTIAVNEMLVTVARTLWRFDMRREPGSTVGGGSPELGWGQNDPENYQVYDAYVALRNGPMVQFRKRQD